MHAPAQPGAIQRRAQVLQISVDDVDSDAGKSREIRPAAPCFGIYQSTTPQAACALAPASSVSVQDGRDRCASEPSAT
jgi:hypothetical protein